MNNPMHIPCHTDIEPEGTELTDEDMDNISAFALCLEGSGIPRSTYQHLQKIFQCKLNIDTEYLMYCRMEMLSGVKPTFHDMCSNSCCLFVGPFAAASHCPFCQIARYHPNGRPIARFSYLPMIPRFQAWYQSTPMIERLKYQTQCDHTAGEITDVFDGQNYLTLLDTFVNINGSIQAHKYFSDHWDITLGGSTDGFQVSISVLFFSQSHTNHMPDICYQASIGKREE
jgi:hypothetical protein